MKAVCDVCDVECQPGHEYTTNHLINKTLELLNTNKKSLASNRNGAVVLCSVKSLHGDIVDCNQKKVQIKAEINETLTFTFKVYNERKEKSLLFRGCSLPYTDSNYVMLPHTYTYGNEPFKLLPKSYLPDVIKIQFKCTQLTKRTMAVIFTFATKDGLQIVIIRELIVEISEESNGFEEHDSVYKNKSFKSRNLVTLDTHGLENGEFKVPRSLKKVFANNLKMHDSFTEEEKTLTVSIKQIFEHGITKENYISFFHHILWYEETHMRINMKKYNMCNVRVTKIGNDYSILVPGLAEKRPSLLKGDKIIIRVQDDSETSYVGVIINIKETSIEISFGEANFKYSDEYLYEVHFIPSREPLERQHKAVHAAENNFCRLFPVKSNSPRNVKRLTSFFNIDILRNYEQKSAIEHIVSGTSDVVPYIIFGPPGTGKTITIVEAILQLLKKDGKNHIMVCTETNMAADHIAKCLLKYQNQFSAQDFLLRANSKFRTIDVPDELKQYSQYCDTAKHVAKNYNILIVTLSHSMCYKKHYKSSHLFIDEAAQAHEPSSLIPLLCLEKKGQLILSGDPQQLGPVCLSRNASETGLGKSLLERMFQDYKELYENDDNYITMLVNNFRSHPSILKLPNELFYDNKLKACTQSDHPISKIDVLSPNKKGDAIEFHGVMSKENKEGLAPSYYNERELELTKQYVQSLIKLKIPTAEIGIVTPYMRQMSKLKKWLNTVKYNDLEVGTTEAFQGKEKTVIIISTVRANCQLLDQDAKFNLGFLVEDKRFNVAITRAKSKLIIIGNPHCLSRDVKWLRYMELCSSLHTYKGENFVDRNKTLIEVDTILQESGVKNHLRAQQEDEEPGSNVSNKT